MRVLGRFWQMPGFPQHADLVGNLAYYQGATGLTSVDFFLVRAADASAAGVARAADAIHSGPGKSGTLRIDTTARAPLEQAARLTALEVLYTRRRIEPRQEPCFRCLARRSRGSRRRYACRTTPAVSDETRPNRIAAEPATAS